MRVRLLAAEEAERERPALAAVLADCVAGGASVSFLSPFTADEASAWWGGVIDSVAAGGTLLFGAYREDALVGTVQLLPSGKPNQPHRADVAKLLVRRAARGRGIAAALMAALEDEARRRGLTLLVLDTVPGTAADRLYTRLGWSRVGVIPNYALWPDGRPCDTSVFYKALSA